MSLGKDLQTLMAAVEETPGTFGKRELPLISARTKRIQTDLDTYKMQTVMEVADPQGTAVFSIGMLWREKPTRYDVAYMLKEMADRLARALEQAEINDFASGLGDVTTEKLR